MNLYKTVTHLMALTLTLLVGLGSIEGLMAADQTPREQRHDRRNRRRGLGKRSLRRCRRAEPPAEDAAHTVTEMGEDSLVIEITYTDGTTESVLLPQFFDELYKTPCHYTCSNCNCCGILSHKTLGDIEVVTIYTYNTETCEYLPHPEFTEKFAAVLDEVREYYSHSTRATDLFSCAFCALLPILPIQLYYKSFLDYRDLFDPPPRHWRPYDPESHYKTMWDFLKLKTCGYSGVLIFGICSMRVVNFTGLKRQKLKHLAQFQPDFSEYQDQE